MKTIMRTSKILRRSLSLLLMMSLLIALLPTAAFAVTTPGAYGTVTVTTKNVVIRTSPAGSRTGYFAQPGDYPMIGPSVVKDGVTWYNIRSDRTSGYVHGGYATADFGSSGMPSTTKKYVKLTAATDIYKGTGTSNPESTAKVTLGIGTVLQLETGAPYSATKNNVSNQYINVYYENIVYHTLYNAVFENAILTTEELNTYIEEILWKASNTGKSAVLNTKGDILTHAVQAGLALLGYYDDAMDGSYGPITYGAVKEFQSKNSLSVTGAVNEATLNKLFPLATARLAYIRANPGQTGGSGGDTGGVVSDNAIKTTVKNLRIRKSYSTSSAYLGMIPLANTLLEYSRTQVSGSVTWYYIKYQGTYGWVMGTYVTDLSSGGGSTPTPSPITDYGTVTITKKWTHIRKTPAGAQTGYHLNTGDVATMIGPAQDEDGYTWYNIRTESGRTGWVRGDCADADFGSAGMPDTDARYVFLKAGMTITKGDKPSNASGSAVPITKDTVLQLASATSYAEGGSNYINVYYNNGDVYHTAYSADLIAGMMTTDALNRYIINTIWPSGLPSGQTAGETLGGSITMRTSDVYVHAIQAALFQLELYTDAIDGIYGSKTADAVKAYKTKFGVSPVNETVGAADSIDLFAAGMAALQAKRTGSGSGNVPSVGEFGTFTKVKKGSWVEIDGGSRSLFPKSSMATVMAVNDSQHRVFRVWRWSGSEHADVVTFDTTDTAVFTAILGMTYDPDPPSASELSLIKASGKEDYPKYTWPKVRWNNVNYYHNTNDAKIPVWVNLNGTVYCASIYIIPHGFDGTSSFSESKRNNQFYYKLNNMYGMICMHFYGSKTHGSDEVNATHMSNINEAYNDAPGYFGSGLVQ